MKNVVLAFGLVASLMAGKAWSQISAVDDFGRLIKGIKVVEGGAQAAKAQKVARALGQTRMQVTIGKAGLSLDDFAKAMAHGNPTDRRAVYNAFLDTAGKSTDEVALAQSELRRIEDALDVTGAARVDLADLYRVRELQGARVAAFSERTQGLSRRDRIRAARGHGPGGDGSIKRADDLVDSNKIDYSKVRPEVPRNEAQRVEFAKKLAGDKYQGILDAHKVGLDPIEEGLDGLRAGYYVDEATGKLVTNFTPSQLDRKRAIMRAAGIDDSTARRALYDGLAGDALPKRTRLQWPVRPAQSEATAADRLAYHAYKRGPSPYGGTYQGDAFVGRVNPNGGTISGGWRSRLDESVGLKLNSLDGDVRHIIQHPTWTRSVFYKPDVSAREISVALETRREASRLMKAQMDDLSGFANNGLANGKFTKGADSGVSLSFVDPGTGFAPNVSMKPVKLDTAGTPSAVLVSVSDGKGNFFEFASTDPKFVEGLRGANSDAAVQNLYATYVKPEVTATGERAAKDATRLDTAIARAQRLEAAAGGNAAPQTIADRIQDLRQALAGTY